MSIFEYLSSSKRERPSGLVLHSDQDPLAWAGAPRYNEVDSDLWQDVYADAALLGFSVEIVGGGEVMISVNGRKDYGVFTANEGGAQMAMRFLASLR